MGGDLILFNPRDNLCCVPLNGEILDYRTVNISPEVMRRAAGKLLGQDEALYFSQNVVFQSEITQALRTLYQAILAQAPKPERKEAFSFLPEQVLEEYVPPFQEAGAPEAEPQIKVLCFIHLLVSYAIFSFPPFESLREIGASILPDIYFDCFKRYIHLFGNFFSRHPII